MTSRLVAYTLLGFALFAVAAFGQQNPLRGPEQPPQQPPPQQQPSAEPDQPVRPQVPILRPRDVPPGGEQAGGYYPARPVNPPRPPQPPQPPFRLTPQEDAQVDRVLNIWEQRNAALKTFDCRFRRWIYDPVFGRDMTKAMFVEEGVIRFAAPDRGLFKVESGEKNGKMEPIDDSRADHWLCDGKSVFQYRPAQKQVEEHRLPRELQGKAIANSPLPFLFGAAAKDLRRRYFIRIITPLDVQDQIWLEAYPRNQQDAANFHHAQFVISTRSMAPFALMLVAPHVEGDKTPPGRINYQFYDIVVNDPWRLFHGDPFKPFTPRGWMFVPDTTPLVPPQAQRPSGGGGIFGGTDRR